MVNRINDLIIKAQKGDMFAFEQILKYYDRHVLNIAFSFRNSEEDSKDIYQEVFIRVFKGLNNFQFKSEFSTWLYRITTNVCISYQSKEKRHKLDSIDKPAYTHEDGSENISDTIGGELSADSLAINSEISNEIAGAVNLLPAQQKMAFVLKHYEGYKIKEVAEIMNCTEGTIKKYLFTANEKLRQLLKHLED
ncbi:MAG: RNA polymerase sigma factor [Bacteroidetes bacterium]|nr:RNA polymerase sigma factor [Bacteroidota bacterium]MBU1678227.1 RNA polymerase sigma factor [Bacteroidota bacterium]MBU2506609.1 RNA polymerase sigma factor [Bacteroidota bacterium]